MGGRVAREDRPTWPASRGRAHGRSWPPPPATTCACRPRTCRWPPRGVGCGSRPRTSPRRWRRSSRATCPLEPAGTRPARGSDGLAGSGTRTPGGGRAVGGLRRRDADQHRAQHRRGEDLAVAVRAGAGEARPHEPAGPSQAADGLLDAAEQQALLRTSGSKRLDDEPWSLPSWCSWTRPRRCSTVSGAPTATRWWTKPRTCRRWSCGRSPGARRAR